MWKIVSSFLHQILQVAGMVARNSLFFSLIFRSPLVSISCSCIAKRKPSTCEENFPSFIHRFDALWSMLSLLLILAWR